MGHLTKKQTNIGADLHHDLYSGIFNRIFATAGANFKNFVQSVA